MDYLHPLLVLAVVHMMAVMSPGQAFIVVSRTALSSGRLAGLAATFACGVGVMPWAVGAILGLALLFQQAPLLYAGLKLAGGLYLIYVAVMVWRHAADPLAAPTSGSRQSPLKAFLDTFLMQVANPKVAVFFGSIFAAVLPANPPAWMIAAILTIVFVNEIVWYTLVTVVFSSAGPRAVYGRLKPVLDRVMAMLLGGLGARLIFDVRQ